MSTAANTLLLDPLTHDLTIDSFGNIAMTTPPYAVAQDVGSAVLTFLGEVWYDTTQGIPYLTEILGYTPTTAQFAQYMNQRAVQVPGVASAQTTITSFKQGAVNGSIFITLTDGTTTTLTF